jgi:hypothetical protein
MMDRFGIALGEASTWRGIIMILTALKIIELNPTEEEAVIAFGMAVAGLIGVFWKRGR